MPKKDETIRINRQSLVKTNINSGFNIRKRKKRKKASSNVKSKWKTDVRRCKSRHSC